MSDQAREIPLPKHWKKTCQGKYLGEWNLYDDARGKHLVVSLTIDERPRGVKFQEVTSERGKEFKLVLRFKGKDLPMIVTNMNGRILAGQFGSIDPDAWHGKSFKLGVEYKKVKGVMTHVLRVQSASARGEELKEMLRPTAPDGGSDDPDAGP